MTSERCEECGTALREIRQSEQFGGWLCLRCYSRAAKLPEVQRIAVSAELPDAARCPANMAEVDRMRQRTRLRLAGSPYATDDALKEIPATEYVPALTGQEPGAAGMICCPFHDDRTPSLKCYPDDRGWFCFGCGEGGSIIDFGSRLYRIEPRGRGFHDIRRQLAADLLRTGYGSGVVA